MLQLPNRRQSPKRWIFLNSVTQKLLQELFWMTCLFVYLKESGHFLKPKKQLINAISYFNVGWQDYQGHR